MALTAPQIVAAAVEILDEYGLADLTMRRLGDHLGVSPGTLYWHIPNKQTLLARVADEICCVEAPSGPWRAALVTWATNLAASLAPHRDASEVVAAARASGLMDVDVVAPGAGILTGVGLSPVPARRAAAAVLHLVLGATSDEHARADWVRLGGAPADRAGGGDAPDLGYGLGLLLDGIAAELEPPSTVR